MKNIFSFLLAGICLVNPLFGGMSERLADYIARNLKGIAIDQNIVDRSDKNILIQDLSIKMVSVQLGRKLGAGWFGSVYDLSEEEAQKLNIDWKGRFQLSYAFFDTIQQISARLSEDLSKQISIAVKGPTAEISARAVQVAMG